MKITGKQADLKKPEEFWGLGNGWYHKVFKENEDYWLVEYQVSNEEYECIKQKRVQILSYRFIEDRVRDF